MSNHGDGVEADNVAIIDGAGRQNNVETDPENLESYYTSQRSAPHASILSFFLHILPNTMGATRSFSWTACMWLLEIPPYLEANIARKYRKLVAKKRLPRADEIPRMAHDHFHIPYLPIMKWGKEYIKHKDWMVADAMAGITIGVMLIPQSMAYALLANMPPIMGLYTAVIAPIFYCFLGTSMHLQIGPTSLISLYLPTAMEILEVDPLHYPDDPMLEARLKADRVSLAPVLAFYVGIIMICMSLLRAGNLIKFCSHAVMTGFVSAAALFIGISQLKYIFGIHVEGEPETNMELFVYYREHAFVEGNKVTQIMGGWAFLIMYLEKFTKRVFPPTAKRMKNKCYKFYKYFATFTTIFVVIITALITRSFYLDPANNCSSPHHELRSNKCIQIVGSLPPGGPPAMAPDFHRWPGGKAFQAALLLALLGYMEAYSVSRKFALQFKYVIDPDQELFALGLGNIFGSMFKSYPTAGNFGRTALASVIGQKSPVANLIVALFISLVLGSLLPALYYIPFATLGAVVCVAVVTLVDWPEMIKAFFLSPMDCFVMVVTFFCTLFINTMKGLQIGMAVSVFCMFIKLWQVDVVALGKKPGESTFVAKNLYPVAQEDPEIKVVRIAGRMAFMNAAQLQDHLTAMVDSDKTPYKDIVFDCAGVSSIDLTAIIALADVLGEAEKHEIRMWFANVCKQLKSNLTMCGLVEKLGGEEMCVKTIEEVYEHAKRVAAEEKLKPKQPKRVVDDHH